MSSSLVPRSCRFWGHKITVRTRDIHATSAKAPLQSTNFPLKKLTPSEPLRISLDILLAYLEELWVHQTSLRTALRCLSRKERYEKAFKVARSLLGIGWFTAIWVVLELEEDLSRFTSGKRIARFRGNGVQRTFFVKNRTKRPYRRYGVWFVLVRRPPRTHG